MLVLAKDVIDRGAQLCEDALPAHGDLDARAAELIGEALHQVVRIGPSCVFRRPDGC